MISEPAIITGESITAAWRGAARLVLEHGERFNLTVHVKDPTKYDEEEIRSLDPKRVRSDLKSVFDVANTIFPRGRGHQTDSPAEFCEHYRKVYERGHSRTPSAWGTYFQRLVRFGEGGRNQLTKIIGCMNEWKTKPRAAFVVHLSGAHLDNPRPLGGPCWQYGQFIRTDDRVVSLSVVYRSHDYFQKALGNFLGLSRLLNFVCLHTYSQPGTLTCLSTYALLLGTKTEISTLLAN